ncbi:transmembrane protein 26-like isoform X1 [Branchiostoma floridae]|uniref:Transmembrane protein 26-like isoform X1 n=1 Tax=Branchiostoma floridae TaxID=7739 RepID=A0A9J7MBS4_BRAFL|nr:transmembrane protein 26-like isoform X1 [Branchiostoma floridae]
MELHCINIIKALITRLLFAVHGLIAIWRVTDVYKASIYWIGLSGLAGLFIETCYTVGKRKGKEYKWWCPSFFFYLSVMVPAIWFLELQRLDERIQLEVDIQLKLMNTTSTKEEEDSGGPIRIVEGQKFFTRFKCTRRRRPRSTNIVIPEIPGLPINLNEVDIPLELSSEEWVLAVELGMLFLLIFGRWVMPRGEVTRDQLSQLLFVYLGSAADILEFCDTLKVDEVKTNKTLTIVILAVFSWSLMQFTLVMTATRSRTRKAGATPKGKGQKVRCDCAKCCECTCFDTDVWATIVSICLQDGPFLATRLVLVAYYRVINHMSIFFTCKNMTVMLLQLYRLIVIYSEKANDDKDEDNNKSNIVALEEGYYRKKDSPSPLHIKHSKSPRNHRKDMSPNLANLSPNTVSAMMESALMEDRNVFNDKKIAKAMAKQRAKQEKALIKQRAKEEAALSKKKAKESKRRSKSTKKT